MVTSKNEYFTLYTHSESGDHYNSLIHNQHQDL